MKRYRKFVVAGVAVLAIAGGAGAAVAAGGGHGGGSGKKETVSHVAPHRSGSGEKGLSSVKDDDGTPGLRKGGTAPAGGGTADTYSYRAR